MWRNAILVGAYAGCVPVANWMIGNVGACIPDGPCLIPVGFGLMAPSGVLMIGVALALRDAVHEAIGWRGALAAITVAAAVSGFVAPPSLAVASLAAFLVSEILDLSVYAPLRRRHLPLAVAVSGIVGAIADSAAFLWLAFGSLDHLAGQVVGKVWVALFVAFLVWVWGSRKESAPS